jgi:hypothetical protein
VLLGTELDFILDASSRLMMDNFVNRVNISQDVEKP